MGSLLFGKKEPVSAGESPGTILVVDDNERNLDICAINLELEGYGVLKARNGREGLDVALRTKPDLILLDIMMPVMDGYEMLKRVRIKPEMTATPILMLTAKASSGDVVRALALGANDYLRKPFDMEEMVARVRTLVNLKKSQDELRGFKRRLAMELSLARGIQESLLPSEGFLGDLRVRGLGVFARTLPASEVNGDFYDLRMLTEGLVCMYLVDCKGHGVSAGLMSMAVHALLDSLVPVLPSANEPLNHIDRKLRSVGATTEFAGVSYLLYDLHSATITASQAGMPFPLVYRKAEGQAAELNTGGGPPLGLPLKPAAYRETVVVLHPGDKLIMFSDGLSEAATDAEDVFGPPGGELLRVINELGHLPAGELGPSLIAAWEQACPGAQEDDMTLMILENLRNHG